MGDGAIVWNTGGVAKIKDALRLQCGRIDEMLTGNGVLHER